MEANLVGGPSLVTYFGILLLIYFIISYDEILLYTIYYIMRNNALQIKWQKLPKWLKALQVLWILYERIKNLIQPETSQVKRRPTKVCCSYTNQQKFKTTLTTGERKKKILKMC